MTLWSEDLLAKLSQSQEDEEVSWIREVSSCTSMSELSTVFAQHGLSGRMSVAHYPTAQMPSGACCAPYKSAGIVTCPGEYAIVNSGEFHSGADVSFLSGILEGGGVAQRYCLSPVACAGILRRAKKNGKNLPEPLNSVLVARAAEGGGVARCFAQNSQNEVRYNNGDGEITGVLAASKDGKGQGVPMVMASRQANAEILTDCAPTLLAAHERPIVCMGDDNGKAAVDVDIAGTLKVGGAQPIVAAPTDKTS